MSELDTAKRFQFIGGNLALDYCNTVGGKRGAVEREYLDSPLQYVGWCEQAGVLSRGQAERALTRAKREPGKANAVIDRAVALREALFRIFDPGRPASHREADITLLNAELARALCRMRLTPSSENPAFTWQWVIGSDALDEPLGPIAHAAATLLTDAHALSHVRICQGDTCGWLFLDSSRNHSRCWCDMRDCGNRAKIRRHRLKLRSGRAA